MASSLKRYLLALCVLSVLCSLACSPKAHAQAIFETLRQFGGWPVFECANVDYQPPSYQQCYDSTGLFGTQHECVDVTPDRTRQIRCDWRKENLWFGDQIAILHECCAAPDSIDLYLEIADPISNWKRLSVSGQSVPALEGTGRGGQNIPPFSSWHRFGLITIKMSDLPGPQVTLSHKNFFGNMDNLYIADLTEFARYRGQKIVFQWLRDDVTSTRLPDPIYATPVGSPLDGTILREDHGGARLVAGEGQFPMDDATLARMYPNAVQYYAADGTLDAALRSAPVDGTLLRDESGAVWVVVGRAKFHVPDPQTQTRLYGMQAPVTVWNGAIDRLGGSPSDGTLLREDEGTVWVMAGGARFPMPDQSVYTRLYRPIPPFPIWNGALEQLPERPSDGSLLREEDGTVWVVFGGARLHVPDPATLSRLYPGGVPTQLWYGATDNLPMTPTDGTLLREESGAIYVVAGRARFHVPDPTTFSAFFPSAVPSQVWNGAVDNIPTVPADGSYFREKSSNFIYVVWGGRRFQAKTVPLSATVHVLWDGALAQIPFAGIFIHTLPRH